MSYSASRLGENRGKVHISNIRAFLRFVKRRGNIRLLVQIAEFTGHHRDTIARVLREEVDKKTKTRQRESRVAVFDAQIAQWLDQNVPVSRMVELARADAEHPHTGGETAFYDYVRKVRHARKQTPRNLALRFEGVPGEYLQIDWGEVRDMPFTKAGMEGQTRYFFAARLKYSRYMDVSFHSDMREETLLRCLLACFTAIDGVPWAVVTDNMKTAVLGRDERHQPVWNPAYQKLAAELLTLRRDTIRMIDGAGPNVEVSPPEAAEQGRVIGTEPGAEPERAARHANQQQNTTETVGEQVQTRNSPKCTFSGVVSIELKRFLDSGVALVECPDCARTRTLSPRNGVLQFPSHDKRKMRTPQTDRRWARRETTWEVVEGESKR